MINIGVSGHRDLGNRTQSILAGIDWALLAIQQDFPSSSYTLLSPLAEGTDRLVAVQAIKLLSAKLVVPLPLEISDYQHDFETEASKHEFANLLAAAERIIQLPQKETRTASYLAAGLYVLDHCDVLIAVWDGLPARGIGGTGQIVELARGQNKPIAWVHVNRFDQPAGNKVKIHYERFPTSGTKAGENEPV